MDPKETFLKRVNSSIEGSLDMIKRFRERKTVFQDTFTMWKAQSLAMLDELLGPGHVYTAAFRGHTQYYLEPDAGALVDGLGVLRAVKADLEAGYLLKLRAVVSAEIFVDLLEQACHLLEQGYKDPAASLCGAVLENGLREAALNSHVSLKKKEDLGSLNQKCAQAGIYNTLVQKKIQVWNHVRNNADHGRFNEYSPDDVGQMLSGVKELLSAVLK